MLRTTFHPRAAARSVALGTLLLVAAAGCGSSSEEGDGAAPAEDPAVTQEDEGTTDGDPSDGGSDTADDAGEGTAASDDGGATDSGAGDAAAEPLPEDADLATEELPVTAERAVEIGTETVGGGDLVQIGIDHDDRTWEWELEIVEGGTQHELDIDATTGDVTEHETDRDDDRDPVVDVASPMAYAEAIEIALGEVPGRVAGWDLDSDDGTIRYQVEIDRDQGDDDVEVEIDVESGDVRVDD